MPVLFLCFSEEFDLKNAAFAIIRGGVIPVDLATVQMQSGQKTYMSIMSCWGYIADLDVESQRFRRLGGDMRYLLGSLKAVAKRRVYSGRFHYLPMEEDLEKRAEEEYAGGGEGGEGEKLNNGQAESQEPLQTSVIGGPQEEESVQQQQESVLATNLLPHSLSDPVPSSWKTIEGNFIMFISPLMPCIGHGFLEDPLTLGSGKMYVTYCLEDMKRRGMLSVLFTYKSGEYLQRDDVHTVKTRAYRLEPLTFPGIIAVDGEEVEYGSHQVQLHPQLARIMSRRRRKPHPK